MSLPVLAHTGGEVEKQDSYRLPLRTFMQLESNRALHAPRSAKIDIWASASVIPQLSLRKYHFMMASLLTLVTTVEGLGAFLCGVPIDRKVDDSIGTSAKADDRISYYQTISGFMSAGLSLVLEQMFKPFLSVILVSAANRPWQPDEVVTSGPTRLKRNVLFWMIPLAMYVVNIGWSSVYIEHLDNDVVHRFIDADLVDTSTVVMSAIPSDRRLPPVYDTILRAALTGQAQPFQINSSSSCSSGSGTPIQDASSLPRMMTSLVELQKTSVTYGFPSRPWNLDAMSIALQPTHQAQLSQGMDARETSERELAVFLSQTNESYDTLEELLIQGLTLHGKVTSSYNSDRTYDCNMTESRCYGVPSTLQNMRSLGGFATPSAADLFRCLPNNTAGLAPEEAVISLERYQISASVSIVALTIDLPFAEHEHYRFIDKTLCNHDGTSVNRDPANPGDVALDERSLCDGTYLNYLSPGSDCGARNCLLYDHTNAFRMEKQILLTSYMENCDPTDVQYDSTLLSWFPEGCTGKANSAFLYGVGSYIGGNMIKRGGQLGPVITDTRGHFKMTFAKMEWHFDDLSSRFGARCDDSKGSCRGLVHALAKIDDKDQRGRVLMVGEQHIPMDHVNGTLKDPIPLVVLREPVVYDKNGDYYSVEYVDPSLLNTNYSTNETLGLDRGHCSVHIDAYLDMVEANHYYMTDPRQPLYTSAIFYLFQNARVKKVSYSEGASSFTNTIIGRVRMQRDLEVKEIRYSVPLASAISSWFGVCIMLVYTVVMIQWPRDAVRLDGKSIPAAQYADVVIDQDELYPKRVYARQLRFRNGAVVGMDDYTVERITLSNVEHPLNAFEMQ